MKFEDVLMRFKSEETAENIVPLLDDSALRNAVVAWKSVQLSVLNDGEEIGEDASSSEMWEWMWSKVNFGVQEFGVVAGCKGQDAHNLFVRLKGLRLIYPDGDINDYAAKYLQAIILSKLPKESRGKR
jgi:hypothetical protein